MINNDQQKNKYGNQQAYNPYMPPDMQQSISDNVQAYDPYMLQNGQNNLQTYNSYMTQSRSKKRYVTVIIIIIICLILFSVCILATAYFMINSAQNSEYYDINGDHVPSVYAAIGERMLNSYNVSTKNGITKCEYNYKLDGSKQQKIDEIKKYMDYLCKTDDFTVVRDVSDELRDPSDLYNGYQFVLRRPSHLDNGCMIYVYISPNSNGYSVKLTNEPDE